MPTLISSPEESIPLLNPDVSSSSLPRRVTMTILSVAPFAVGLEIDDERDSTLTSSPSSFCSSTNAIVESSTSMVPRMKGGQGPMREIVYVYGPSNERRTRTNARDSLT